MLDGQFGLAAGVVEIRLVGRGFDRLGRFGGRMLGVGRTTGGGTAGDRPLGAFRGACVRRSTGGRILRGLAARGGVVRPGRFPALIVALIARLVVALARTGGGRDLIGGATTGRGFVVGAAAGAA